MTQSETQTYKEAFAQQLLEAIDHLKVINDIGTDNAAILQLANAMGMTGPSIRNWFDPKKTTVPNRNNREKLIKAIHEMTQDEPFPASWYANFLRNGDRRREKIEFYQRQVAEFLEEEKEKERSYHEIEQKSLGNKDRAKNRTDNQFPQVQLGDKTKSIQTVDAHAILDPEQAQQFYGSTVVKWNFGIAIGWWLIVGIFPILSMLIEFGPDYGFYFARVYPHLFFQPLLFGLLIGVALASQIRILVHYRSLNRLLIIGAIIGLLATLPEVFTGDTAIWEIAPRIVHVLEAVDQISLSDQFHTLLAECYADQMLKMSESCRYMQFTMANKLRSQTIEFGNSSVTRWFYTLSFFLFISTISIFVQFADFLRRDSAKLSKDSLSFRNLGILCGWSTVLISFWFPLRLASEVLKRTLYPDVNSIPTITISLLFIIVCCYFFSIYQGHFTAIFPVTITICILVSTIVLFFFLPHALVSISIGRLASLGFTENALIVISKYVPPFTAFLIFSWHQITEMLMGNIQFWDQSS